VRDGTTEAHALGEQAPPPSPGEPSELPRREGAASWPPWTAPAALVSGLVLAAVGALLVDIPAVAAGVKITTSHVPPGLEIADTTVQDIAFVLVAVFFAQLGGRKVSAWQLGLRPSPLWRAVRLIVLTLLAFLFFAFLWSLVSHAEKEKLLKQLGTGESTLLLVLSAALTCVVAPICEEILFRGFIFSALRNWRGTWPAAILTGLAFGGVHAGSAPAADLIPLAALGFGLCLLYRATGSLYPCIAAHSLNNSLAFGSLENWSWQIPVLMAAALGAIALLALALMRAGLISGGEPAAKRDAFAVSARG
jgi:membrane protease YdiL (CAAX protease family)